MKKKVRRTVLIETEQVSIFLDRSACEIRFCSECGPGFAMLSPEQVIRLSHIPIREIYRLVESDKVHYVDQGRLLVCLESLLAVERASL